MVGTWHYMAKALQKYCGDAIPLESIPPLSSFVGKVMNKLTADLWGKKFDFMHREFFAKRCARYTASKLNQREYDFIFAPAASTEIAFLEVDWERKGGDLALETFARLKKSGVKAELTICGCTPPRSISEEGVEIIPFLDKSKKADRDKLENLFLHSDFLLLPTKTECYGIVFCEANAFGLPIISRDIGGVSSVVKNNENGFTLPPDASARDYAELIKSVYENDDKYYELVVSSRSAFEKRLNWDAWGQKVNLLIRERLFAS